MRVLRDRDRPTKAFVRLNSRYGELEQRGAQLVIGDLRRDRDIAKACEGVRYIISTHGSERDPAQIQYRANIELIDRAVAEGVEHFVYLSVLGCDRGYEDSLVFKAKREVERYLQASGLNYTILRPSGFASNLLPLAENFRQTGVYLLIGDPQNRTSIVSTDDLARIAVDSVEIEAARNQVFAVGGPDILQREDIPRIFGRLFNREPLILNPPLLAFDGVRNALGVVNPQLQKSLGTLRVLLANEYFCTPAEVERLESVYSLKLESLEGFLRRYLAV